MAWIVAWAVQWQEAKGWSEGTERPQKSQAGPGRPADQPGPFIARRMIS